MLHENVVKCYNIWNRFHNLIEKLQALIDDTILRKIFILVTQKIFFNTDQGIPKVLHDVVGETFLETERFNIFKLKLTTQLDKVVVLKNPIVENKILKRQVCFVNLSLNLCQAKL